jgi:hypothetical protein
MLRFSARIGVSRRGRRQRSLLIAVATGIGDAKIMLRVLIEIFSRDTVVPDPGFPCERDVALENLSGTATYPYIRAVAVEGLVALRCPLLLLRWPVAAKATARWTLI